jgi:putative ATPase
VAGQRYAPDAVANRTYYEPTRHGVEERVAERAERIRAVLGKGQSRGQAESPSKGHAGSSSEGRSKEEE